MKKNKNRIGFKIKKSVSKKIVGQGLGSLNHNNAIIHRFRTFKLIFIQSFFETPIRYHFGMYIKKP